MSWGDGEEACVKDKIGREFQLTDNHSSFQQATEEKECIEHTASGFQQASFNTVSRLDGLEGNKMGRGCLMDSQSSFQQAGPTQCRA